MSAAGKACQPMSAGSKACQHYSNSKMQVLGTKYFENRALIHMMPPAISPNTPLRDEPLWYRISACWCYPFFLIISFVTGVCPPYICFTSAYSQRTSAHPMLYTCFTPVLHLLYICFTSVVKGLASERFSLVSIARQRFQVRLKPWLLKPLVLAGC